MYNKTRNEAAELLGVSTRSIDRYIKAGKLRSEKIGKIIYINNTDLNNINGGGKKTQEVIVPKTKIQQEYKKEIQISNNETKKSDFIYKELLDTIKQKDKKIEDLSIKVGNAEQIIKNSISMIEYKKSQFLLEQKEEYAKNELEQEIKNNKNLLEKEKNINKILVLMGFLLLITAIIIWFSKI